MISRHIKLVGVSLALLALVIGQQPAAANDALGISGVLGGIQGAMGDILGGAGNAGIGASGLVGGAGGIMNGAGGLVSGMVNSATNMMSGITNPVMGTLGSMSSGLLSQTGINGMLSSTLGGLGTLTGGEAGIMGNTLRLTTGAMNGLSAGLNSGLGGLAQANSISSLAQSAVGQSLVNRGGLVRNQFKRQAIPDGAMLGASNNIAAQAMLSGNPGNLGNAAMGAVEAVASDQSGGAASILGAATSGELANPVTNQALAVGSTLGTAVSDQVGAGQPLLAPNNPLGGRQALTLDAVKNAQAESASAGAEMVANGAINARSASLASNAYRQAKLASARDRVNIAGTIQNSARISDAAIATHDAAIKAEDSLLGSELAVDSASTVLDSDAAYIPPVTNSLLRSLPYGRLGIRNIVPKPLTMPSYMLPDVWLNGAPLNYLNVPLRMQPFGFGQGVPTGNTLFNGQPFMSNNGIILNGLVFDPAYAYMLNGNINALVGSSLAPILANNQLEAQDELAMANLVNMQQMNGAGMASTYQGYGRLNPVPMITGTVSDINLMPTTTIGTTYPIGSALVIEPRDSYFQDYTDNASSRQNFDERQQ